MKRETLATTTLTLLFLSAFSLISPQVKATPSASLTSDAFFAPDVPRGHNSSIVPGYYETSEYLIGSVAVGIILLESNGTVDVSTEDWTSLEESKVISEIETGLSWWASQNPYASVSFKYDIHYLVPTSYEPISRPAFPDQELWVSEAMTYMGYPGIFYFAQVRDYINDLRRKLATDWAYAMIIVDSSNDSDGRFADGRWYAYAYLGGPFLVMTYDNSRWGIESMDRVSAHETGHIFYATDEYNGVPEWCGYLNVLDTEFSGGLMDRNIWSLSPGTWGQVGWRDTDGDGIQDIVDTFPKTVLSVNSSGLDENPVSVTYKGFVTEVPYPNRNPFGTGRDLTINTITNMEIKLDNETWTKATATDGAFDEAEETITFFSTLSIGIHVLNIRADNSIGNTEVSYLSHEIGQISVATSFRTPRDNWVTIIVDKTTFQVIATSPYIIKLAIKITNIDFSHETNSMTAFYFIPFAWDLDPNSVQVQLVRVGHDVRTIRKEHRLTTFASNILLVYIPDIRAAVGDPLSYGDSLTITFKLKYLLRNGTLSDDYAWSNEGPIYHFAFASEPIRTKLKWLLGPPWVWKRP